MSALLPGYWRKYRNYGLLFLLLISLTKVEYSKKTYKEMPVCCYVRYFINCAMWASIILSVSLPLLIVYLLSLGTIFISIFQSLTLWV